MLGTVDIKLRPLRFAFLVEPGSAEEKQAREAIRLASRRVPTTGWTQRISSRSGAWEVAQVGPNGRSITAAGEEDPRQ